MSTLFICYRHQDSADVTGRIYDRLVLHYGPGQVFKDVDCLPLGVELRSYLTRTIQQCRAILVILGKNWLESADPTGKKRLEDEHDLVRTEIEAALAHSVPVIPVLVQGASMPAEKQLPQGMCHLAFLSGLAVRPDPDFHRDMDRLIHLLDRLLGADRKDDLAPEHRDTRAANEWMI